MPLAPTSSPTSLPTTNYTSSGNSKSNGIFTGSFGIAEVLIFVGGTLSLTLIGVVLVFLINNDGQSSNPQRKFFYFYWIQLSIFDATIIPNLYLIHHYSIIRRHRCLCRQTRKFSRSKRNASTGSSGGIFIVLTHILFSTGLSFLLIVYNEDL